MVWPRPLNSRTVSDGRIARHAPQSRRVAGDRPTKGALHRRVIDSPRRRLGRIVFGRSQASTKPGPVRVNHFSGWKHSNAVYDASYTSHLRPRMTSMTPKHVAQVQQSFAMVAPVADEAAAMFYGRLFEIAPHLQALFRGDLAEQGRKLMATWRSWSMGYPDSTSSSRPRAPWPNATSPMGSSGIITARSVSRCCGPWSAASAHNGLQTSQPPGRRRTRRFPIT
jgi:hypothetical protein